MGWSFGAWCIGTYLQRYGIEHLRGLILVSGLFGDINQCLSLLQEQHKPALEVMNMLTNPKTPPHKRPDNGGECPGCNTTVFDTPAVSIISSEERCRGGRD
jgi:hypothetical protein